MSWRPIWMLDHTYLSSFEATVDNIFSSLSSSCLYPSHSPSLPVLLLASYCFNHKGATGNFWWAVAVLLSHCFFPLSSRRASARTRARTQPLQATTTQIWRDEAHVATDKPLWSISWMRSESLERKALKIKPCPWCAQQWLCGQWCQRQPANIKELRAAGLSVLNTN